jgi:2-polyprenyl-3-methyl-5-hydroxy-6-metoxy-1,4-benzoquinol methylase
MKETLETVSCNLCGGRETRLYLDMGPYAYRRCRSCGLIYQNPRPVFRDLRRRYGEGYFKYEFSNQANFFNLMKLGLGDIGFDEYYNGRNGDRRFLDIGCATGLLLNYMKSKGWQIQGVEVCRESAEYGMRNYGIPVHIGTLDEAVFPDHSFDAVHFSHVIEHVPDPRSMLLEVKRVLKPEGRVVITTPNVGGLQARWARKGWRSSIPDHVYLFSKKTLRRMLEKTGYRVVDQISWGGIPAGKRPDFVKRPADRLAKTFNLGDVMLFHAVLDS